MKKMRQTLALLLAGALTVGSFAGCGGASLTVRQLEPRQQAQRQQVRLHPAATHRSLSQMTV